MVFNSPVRKATVTLIAGEFRLAASADTAATGTSKVVSSLAGFADRPGPSTTMATPYRDGRKQGPRLNDSPVATKTGGFRISQLAPPPLRTPDFHAGSPTARCSLETTGFRWASPLIVHSKPRLSRVGCSTGS